MGKIWIEQGNASRPAGISPGLQSFGSGNTQDPARPTARRFDESMLRQATPLSRPDATAAQPSPERADNAQRQGASADPTDAFPERLRNLVAALSRSEIVVCNLIRKNSPSKDIAAQLGISKHTVDTHRKSIRRKLRLNEKESLYSVLIRL